MEEVVNEGSRGCSLLRVGGRGGISCSSPFPVECFFPVRFSSVLFDWRFSIAEFNMASIPL